MGELSKEDAAYLDGLEYALRIVKRAEERGVEALEQELTFRRGMKARKLVLPRNIDRQSIAALARSFIQPELEAISVSLANTIQNVLKLPPSKIALFLKSFNEGVDLYRHDEDAKQKMMRELDRDWGLQETSRKYMGFYKERENGKD